jgi:hypothetical protein
MYLVFWFAEKAPSNYKELPSYGISKSGDEFLKFAYIEKNDRKYVDFDEVLKEFIEKCKQEEILIEKLLHGTKGKFNIEIVPEMSAYSSTPSIIINRELIEFINSLGNKFDYLEVDTYII